MDKNKNKKKVNESPDLATVAAGVAAVIGSGVGLAGLMEYLKKKYPEVYAALSDLGAAAGDSRTKGVNESRLRTITESIAMNEATVSDEQLARIDALKEAYGDDFIVNLVMKLDNDTLEDILETMERDMGIGSEEEEEEEEEQE